MSQNKVRHVMGVSGGKDSAALAIFLKDKVKDVEYFFCDTGAELRETYDYLEQLEEFLGKKIIRLNPDHDFDWFLKWNGNFLPSSGMRWCTPSMKLKPMEAWIGTAETISYVAIRADEDSRKGYMATGKNNITTKFPFIENGIDKAGVMRILEESGIGLPKYYEWRTRSGCYFCFFQRKMEWVGLKERHPDLFEKAKAYEKFDEKTGKRFTWCDGESLEELTQPKRVQEIKEQHKKFMEREVKNTPNKPLIERFGAALDADDDSLPCMVCNL